MTKHNLPFPTAYLTQYINDELVSVSNGDCHPFDFAAQVASDKTTKGDNQPFFVMNVGRVAELLDTWFTHLPRVQPFYSPKCNSDPVLMRLLSAHPSVGFNCKSIDDLQLAREYVPPERVLCSLPCWTRSALVRTDEQNVELMCFESERDLDRILSNRPDAKLLLRVCVSPNSDDPNALFGAPLDKAPELLQLCADLGLCCMGIAFSVGTDCICPSAYDNAIECSARLFRLGTQMGLKMAVLNIGGGFECVFEEACQYARFAQLCAEINQSLELHFPPNGFGPNGELRVIATPGRFFAGSAFSLVTNVIGKRCADASYVTNNDFDSGNAAFLYQINESYYNTFGCRMVTNCDPRCAPLFNANADPSENVYGSVFGLTGFDGSSETEDVVQSICYFRQLNIGDWLIWANMGAYSFGNRGSLEDDDDFGEFSTPRVFYFSSEEAWKSASRSLRTTKYFTYTAAEDSCGEEAMSQSESEDTDEMMEESDGGGGRAWAEEEENSSHDEQQEDDFWPLEWSFEFDE